MTTSSHHYDVIVVGVGTMGAATLDQLARRGVRVLGIEQFEIGHEFGSASGDTRLIRKAYFEHPDYVPLLGRAYDLWDDLGVRTGEKVLFRTGAVYLGERVIGGSREAADVHGLDYEMLAPADVVERCGPFVTKEPAMFEPDGGYVLAAPSIELMVREARRAGAEVRPSTTVTGWRTSSNTREVTVEAGGDRFTADHLVITAGPWAPQLLGELRVPLRVTRQVLFWLEPAEPTRFESPHFTCWAACVDGHDGIFYGFPLSERGLKVAHHLPGAETDPDALAPVVDADFAPVRDALGQVLPSALGEVVDTVLCRYTVSPDEHFVIDRHPVSERVTIATGFSGHGFKFAPVIGEVLADLATEGRTQLPVGFLSLDRFSR